MSQPTTTNTNSSNSSGTHTHTCIVVGGTDITLATGEARPAATLACGDPVLVGVCEHTLAAKLAPKVATVKVALAHATACRLGALIANASAVVAGVALKALALTSVIAVATVLVGAKHATVEGREQRRGE